MQLVDLELVHGSFLPPKLDILVYNADKKEQVNPIIFEI